MTPSVPLKPPNVPSLNRLQLKASKSEDPAVLAVVDVARAKFGLPTFKALRSGEAKEQADFDPDDAEGGDSGSARNAGKGMHCMGCTLLWR
jgi:hypothetical protein